jgi:hypothetical protein
MVPVEPRGGGVLGIGDKGEHRCIGAIASDNRGSIMIPALHDIEPLLPALTGNAIHQPVLAENAAAAPALQGILQRLGPAEALERYALDVADRRWSLSLPAHEALMHFKT